MFREAEVKLIGDNLIRIDKIKLELEEKDAVGNELSIALYNEEDECTYNNFGRFVIKSVDYLNRVAECYVDLSKEDLRYFEEMFNKGKKVSAKLLSSYYHNSGHNLLTWCAITIDPVNSSAFIELPIGDLIKSVERLRRHNEMYLRKRWEKRINAVETLRNNLDKI